MQPVTTHIMVSRRDGLTILRAKGRIPGGRTFRFPLSHVVVAAKGPERKAEVRAWLTDNGLAVEKQS